MITSPLLNQYTTSRHELLDLSQEILGYLYKNGLEEYSKNFQPGKISSGRGKRSSHDCIKIYLDAKYNRVSIRMSDGNSHQKSNIIPLNGKLNEMYGFVYARLSSYCGQKNINFICDDYEENDEEIKTAIELFLEEANNGKNGKKVVEILDLLKEEKIEKALDLLGEFDNEISSLRSKISELGRKKNLSNEDNDFLREVNTRLEEDLIVLEEQKNQLGNRIDMLENQVAQLQAHIIANGKIISQKENIINNIRELGFWKMVYLWVKNGFKNPF